MKFIRLTGLFLLTLNAFLLTSCGDDDCTPPSVSENIVGTWTVLGSTVEFQADGTLIDPDDAIIGVEINGVVYDQKTYVATDSNLEVTAMPSNGSGSSSADFEIAGNECNKITLNVFGVDFAMSRQ